MGFHMYSPLQGTFVDYITLKDMILKKEKTAIKNKDCVHACKNCLCTSFFNDTK